MDRVRIARVIVDLIGKMRVSGILPEKIAEQAGYSPESVRKIVRAYRACRTDEEREKIHIPLEIAIAIHELSNTSMDRSFGLTDFNRPTKGEFSNEPILAAEFARLRQQLDTALNALRLVLTEVYPTDLNPDYPPPVGKQSKTAWIDELLEVSQIARGAGKPADRENAPH